MTIQGRLQPLLTGERTALNFLQRMSGVATLTARYVAAVRGTGCRVLDTRYTDETEMDVEIRLSRAGHCNGPYW